LWEEERELWLGVAMAAVIVTADRVDAMDLQEPANPTVSVETSTRVRTYDAVPATLIRDPCLLEGALPSCDAIVASYLLHHIRTRRTTPPTVE
jgi:hypothetical protein